MQGCAGVAVVVHRAGLGSNTQGIGAAEAEAAAAEAAPDAPARATEAVPVVCTAEVEARFWAGPQRQWQQPPAWG